MTLAEVALDIPMPAHTQPAFVYPWDTVPVGGSFPFNPNTVPASCWTAAWRAGRDYAPKKFTARKLNGEMRCWRVA